MNSANLSIGLAVFYWLILHNNKNKNFFVLYCSHLFTKIFTFDIIKNNYSVLS